MDIGQFLNSLQLAHLNEIFEQEQVQYILAEIFSSRNLMHFCRHILKL